MSTCIDIGIDIASWRNFDIGIDIASWRNFDIGIDIDIEKEIQEILSLILKPKYCYRATLVQGPFVAL